MNRTTNSIQILELISIIQLKKVSVELSSETVGYADDSYSFLLFSLSVWWCQCWHYWSSVFLRNRARKSLWASLSCWLFPSSCWPLLKKCPKHRNQFLSLVSRPIPSFYQSTVEIAPRNAFQLNYSTDIYCCYNTRR